MTWYADNSKCEYFPLRDDSTLRAIGWLNREQEFTVGKVDASVYERLVELLRDPWQPVVFFGAHACDLCRFAPEARSVANLFVPGSGCVYVCPELILHYMNAHGYCPPEEFCSAVLSCPDTRSIEYKKALIKNGLKIGEPTNARTLSSLTAPKREA